MNKENNPNFLSVLSDKIYSPLCLFNSISIFLFSALMLVVPGGYSYGAALLLIASSLLLIFRIRIKLNSHDLLIIWILFVYFFTNVVLNVLHRLPASSYDLPARYLLAIPVFILLRSYPPKPIYFWMGIAVGIIGAGIFAIYQLLIRVSWYKRADGFLNSIQFGDIGFLLSAFMVIAIIFLGARGRYFLYFFTCALIFGVITVIFSGTRGALLSIPFFALFFWNDFKKVVKWKYIVATIVIVLIFLCFVYLLPSTNFLKIRVNETIADIEYYMLGGRESLRYGDPLSTRATMWENGVIAFFDKPIVGWGGMSDIKLHYASRWSYLNEIDNFTHFHNEYIDSLAKRGVVGFFALIAAFLIPLRYFFHLSRGKRSDVMPFAVVGVTLVLCVIAFGLTQCFLAHNSGTMVFVFYLIIIAAYCNNFIDRTSLDYS